MSTLSSKLEVAIVRKLVERLAEAGYEFFVDEEDGGNSVWTTSVDECFRQLFQVGYGRLIVRHSAFRLPKNPRAFVAFSYGDGEDVIQDYSVSLEPIVGPLLSQLSHGDYVLYIQG